MARALLTQSASFEFGRATEPDYKDKKLVNFVVADATDERIQRFGRALAKLRAGDELTGAVVTKKETISD